VVVGLEPGDQGAGLVVPGLGRLVVLALDVRLDARDLRQEALDLIAVRAEEALELAERGHRQAQLVAPGGGLVLPGLGVLAPVLEVFLLVGVHRLSFRRGHAVVTAPLHHHAWGGASVDATDVTAARPLRKR
jgi:hypothetical protein